MDVDFTIRCPARPEDDSYPVSVRQVAHLMAPITVSPGQTLMG